MDKRITKIHRRNNGETIVQYQGTSASGARETITVRSADDPNPALLSSLDLLRRHVINVLGLPQSYENGMTIRGVDFFYGGEDEGDNALPKVVIRADKSIEGIEETFKIRTPSTTFAAPAAMDIEDVCARAVEYAEGDRAQMQLFEQAA